MHLIIKLLLTVSTLALLTSCATMNDDECRTADWQLIGFGDGARGYSASRISSHQKACAEVGVSPDLSAYTKGRGEGLLEYCKPITGYRLGLQGSRYKDVCPAELEANFSRGYSYGKEIYIKKSELSSLKRQLSKEQDEYSMTVEIIDHKEKRLVQDGIPKHKRIRLLEQIKDLGADLAYSEARLESLQREIYDLRYDLDGLKESNPYSGAR